MNNAYDFIKFINRNNTDCIIRAIYEKQDGKKHAIPFHCKMDEYPDLEPQLKQLCDTFSTEKVGR